MAMYLILSVVSIVVLLFAFNYGIKYFLVAFGAVVSIWFVLIYYPKKYKINYFSWFTALVAFVLIGFLIFFLLFISKE